MSRYRGWHWLVSMIAESRHSRQSFRPSLRAIYRVSRGCIKWNMHHGKSNFLQKKKKNVILLVVAWKMTDLHSLTAAAPRSAIMFMRRAVFLNPKWMCPIFNKTSMVCWNLSKDIYFKRSNTNWRWVIHLKRLDWMSLFVATWQWH